MVESLLPDGPAIRLQPIDFEPYNPVTERMILNAPHETTAGELSRSVFAVGRPNTGLLIGLWTHDEREGPYR